MVVIIMTGFDDEFSYEDAMKLGVRFYKKAL
jgi:hypothetical protein